MALIKCPKCRHQVEPSEHECPKCGIIFKKYQEGVLKAQKAFEEKADAVRKQQDATSREQENLQQNLKKKLEYTLK